MDRFAMLQLSGCAGCEVSLLDAEKWVGEHRLVTKKAGVDDDWL